MSKNVLQEIALSYAILATGRQDLTLEHLGFEGDNDGIEEDEELIEETFECDVINHTITEVINWYGEKRYQPFGDKSVQKWITDNGLAVLDSDGGGEGGAEYCYTVFSWQGKTYKIEYSYYSYDGYNCEDAEETLQEVKPVQKTITVWE